VVVLKRDYDCRSEVPYVLQCVTVFPKHCHKQTWNVTSPSLS